MRTGRRVTFFTALFLTVMMLFNAVPVYAWSDSGLPCSTGTFVRLYGFDDAPGGYYLGTWRVTITGAKSGSGRTVHINTFENGGGYGYNFVKYGDIEKVAKELNGNPDWVAEEAEEYKVKISWNSGSQDRIYIRHLAKLCGGVVTRYEQGQIDVLTTPYPTANISLPSTIKAGESVKISISGTSNVHKSCPQDISYVLKIEDDTVKEGKKSKSFSEQASYTFNKAGEYTLVLEVTDGVGRTTTVEKEVTVKAQATPPEPEPPSDGNYPPVADFDMPSSAEVGESVRITDQSYDRDGKIVNWKWEVSPSTYSGTLSGSSGGTLTFNQAGTYTIKLTVTDDDGATDSESKKIYVGKSEPEPPPPPPTPENNPPVAKFKMPSVTGPGKEVQVTNTSYDSDGEIVEVEWDISPEDGVTNNLGDDGGTLVFSKLGTYTVELTVTDDFGDSDSYEKEIEVVNEAPKARISMPETAMQGEDITIESLSSDPDGEIVDMIWSVEPSNGMVGTLSGEKSTVYFDVPGTYTITLKVIDNYGGEATDTEQIEITPAIPKAFFTDQGVYKQNRKLTFIEQGISPSRYTIDTREWVIEPVGNGATQEAIKIKGNLTDQTIYALFKTPGDYKVRLRVHNTAGNWSEWYEQTYTIYPDEPPVADFWVDSVVLREYTDTPGDENAEYYAVISPRDASYTTDGDTISRRVWKYKYDSDNDGSFEDETWQVLSDGNEMTPELRTTEVGKYLFELEVYEEFGEETLEEFLTPEDVRSDNTADKAVDDKRSEVSNLRPVVSFDLIRKKKADIIFTVGNIEAMPSMTWSNQYYDRAQFTQVIEAESSSAIKSGTWHLNPAGNVVWMSNGSIKATFSKAGRAVYVQLNDCDHNDGYIDVYVDGVFYGSQNTRGQGHYACEITNLPNTTHTVEVKTGGNGDLHIDYFAIKDMPQTVFDATIAQNLDGLINQYLKPALNENSVDYKISSVQTSTITSQTNFPWKVYNLYGTGLGTGDGQFSVDGNSYRYRGYGSEAPIDHLYYDDGLNAVREFTFNIDMTGYNACATVIPGFIFGANDTNGFKGYIALMWHNAVGVYYFSGNNHTVLTRNGAGNVAANRNPSSFGGQQVAYVNTRSFSLQKSFKMIYKAPTLEIYEDGALLTTVNCPQAAGTGYGVAAANSSHGCGARSYIQFQNFTLKTTAGVTLDEVLKNSSLWRENSARFLVNISAAPYPEFNDPAKAAYIYSRLLSDRIDFCVLGSSANQAQAINVININDSNGTFILNSNRNTTMQQLTDYIINKINSLYPPITDYVLLKEEVYYQTYYEDSENDPKHSEQWTYQHDPNYFENTLGLAPYHNHPLPGPVTVFDKVGKFDVEFIARDNPKDDDRFDEYRLWSLKPLVGKTLYVHRKPIAQFTVTLTPSGSNFRINITDQSYDLDHESQPNKGIIAKQWKWKEATATTWNSGTPSTITAGKVYLIYLRVQDEEGVWSDPEVKVVSNLNLPPVALFEVRPVTQVLNKPLNVTDKSYDPNGDAIVKWTWAITRPDNSRTETTSTSKTIPSQVTNISSMGVGTYKVELKVQDSQGLWSEPYSQYVTIINGNLPPVVEELSFSPDPITADEPYTRTVRTSDPEGDPIIAYEWKVTKPDGTTVTVTKWELTFEEMGFDEDGEYTIQLRVLDDPSWRHPNLESMWSEPKIVKVTVEGRLAIEGETNKDVYRAGEAIIIYATTTGKAYKVEAEMWYSGNEFTSDNTTELVPDEPLTDPPQDVMTWHTRHEKGNRDIVVIIPKNMPDGTYEIKLTAYKRLLGGGEKTAEDTITVRVEGVIYDDSKSQIIGR